jgi:hypothetical protein
MQSSKCIASGHTPRDNASDYEEIVGGNHPVVKKKRAFRHFFLRLSVLATRFSGLGPAGRSPRPSRMNLWRSCNRREPGAFRWGRLRQLQYRRDAQNLLRGSKRALRRVLPWCALAPIIMMKSCRGEGSARAEKEVSRSATGSSRLFFLRHSFLQYEGTPTCNTRPPLVILR